MRYIDSGARDRAHALGAWLETALAGPVDELRWQSGFFSVDALGLFAPTLARLRAEGKLARVLIGSNDSNTLGQDVHRLAELLGLPRSNAQLGVVSYAEGFFHPKTYHFRRSDGSQAAYVGSANLTSSGVSGLHVEAGILLDTLEGDPHGVLDEIAAAVDAWFNTAGRTGFENVPDTATIDRLGTDGVLATVRPPRPPRPTGASGATGGTAPPRPRLRPLVSLPSLPQPAVPPAPVPPPAPAVPAVPVAPVPVSVPNPGFPAYLLFAPGATNPTVGAQALSGAMLPGGAVGLVVRLNRDSSRHFDDRSGTANISILVATVATLRFGIYNGKYQRPRAEYDLHMRYASPAATLVLGSQESNIMAYGFAQGESGHGDVRMVVPAAVRELRDRIRQRSLHVPQDGDLALLEWPTSADPAFGLTFLDQASPVGQQAQQLFAAATATQQLVGDGACWLPPGVSPTW